MIYFSPLHFPSLYQILYSGIVCFSISPLLALEFQIVNYGHEFGS